jgi:hypothetical protein
MPLDIMIGRNRLTLDMEYAAFMGIRLKCDEIARVRWGIFKQYMNGIRTVRSYTVGMGTGERIAVPLVTVWRQKPPDNEITIECARLMERENTIRERYSTIVANVWEIVGVTILRNLLRGLDRGETFPVGSTAVTKDGVWITDDGFFKSERRFVPWEKLAMSSAKGQLHLGEDGRGPSISMSFRDVDNVVVLERLIEFLWSDHNFLKLRRGELGA